MQSYLQKSLTPLFPQILAAMQKELAASGLSPEEILAKTLLLQVKMMMMLIMVIIIIIIRNDDHNDNLLWAQQLAG